MCDRSALRVDESKSCAEVLIAELRNFHTLLQRIDVLSGTTESSQMQFKGYLPDRVKAVKLTQDCLVDDDFVAVQLSNILYLSIVQNNMRKQQERPGFRTQMVILHSCRALTRILLFFIGKQPCRIITTIIR